MESMELHTLSDSNESCGGFDGFTPHDITQAQNRINRMKNNGDDFTTSETSCVDSETSISEITSELSSDDNIITSDDSVVDSVDDIVVL